MEQTQQRRDDRVAPILPTQKRQYFLLNVLQTLLGISFTNQNKFFNFALYICPPIIIIIISTQIKNYVIASVLSSLLPSIVVIIVKIIKYYMKKKQEQQQFEKSQSLLVEFLSICILVAYSYCAHNHFYHLSLKLSITTIGISFITLITSMYSLHSKSTKQFGMLTHQFNQFAWKSSCMVRPILCLIFLIPQTVLFLINDNSGALNVLEIIYSFLWISWTAGLVTNLKYTIQYSCETINSIIFGEQTKQTFSRKIISLVLNLIIVFGIQTQFLTQSYFIITNSIIIVTSFASSTFLMALCIGKADQFSVQKQTNYYEIAYQFLLVIIKVLFTIFVQATEINIIILLVIDIGLYIFSIILIDLNKARNHFGYANCFHNQKIQIVLRGILRLTIDISFTLLARAAFDSIYFTDMFWSALVFRIIVYRSYKRAIFKPLDLQIHLSFLIGLIFINSLEIFFVPLLMLPLPENIFLYLVASFVIPKKNIHKNEAYYRIIYLIITISITFLYLFTFGILEMTMIFGLPIFLWSIPQFNEIQFSANGKQKFIYLNLVKNLPPVVKNLETGTYLIRISKYLTICRILQKGIGYKIVQFRGLESQQITSCHNIESQTIDNMIEQIWGDNKKSWSLDFLTTVLRPISKQTHHLFEQNQIKLTGIIQSQEFITLFKNNFLKTILYFLKKAQFNQKQFNQMKKVKSELKLMISVDEAYKIYPAEFAKLLGITQTAEKKQFSQKTNIKQQQPKITVIKEKLPPIQKPKIKVFEDLDFMVEQSPINKNSKNQKKSFQKQIIKNNQKDSQVEMASKQQLFDKKIHPQTHKQLFQSQTEDHMNFGPPLSQPCYFQLSIIFYILCIGKNKFIDQKKLFDVIKNQQSAQKILKNLEFDGKGKLGLKALRAAFKLSIDKYINGDFSLQIADIQDHLLNQYIGILQEKQFQQAITQLKKDIWVLNFKQQINIHRYHERPVDLYLFKLEQSIVKSIWNNLRFQLLYATNDDDQRYSIQTHPNFLRNILIESAIQPLGYAPFYSGLLVL